MISTFWLYVGKWYKKTVLCIRFRYFHHYQFGIRRHQKYFE